MRKVFFAIILVIISQIPLFSQSNIKTIGKSDVDYFIDVFSDNYSSIFKIPNEINTKLKMQNFLNSSEGKIYKDSLKILKSTILKTTYQLSFKYNFNEYDIKKKMFWFFLLLRGGLFNTDKYSIDNYWFPSLPIEFNSQELPYIGLKCDEKTALKIEGKDLDIFIQFNFNGQIKENKLGNARGMNFDESYPITKNVKIIIKENNSTIFSKSY